MHIPNQKCRIYAYVDVDINNQPIYEEGKLEFCSVVTYRLETMNTPVRADTSASQGRSTMQRATLRIILTPRSSVTYGAKFELMARQGEFFKVADIHPRYDAMGVLDQYEVDLEKI